MTRKDAIIAGVVGLSALAMGAPAAHAEESKEANPEVEKIRALLKAHDQAMTSQDLKGVMACFTEKAAIMGTGPGEIWVGPDEIKVAYEHFFEGFDKGEQNFEYQFKIGGVTADMGWLMASGNITGKKDGKDFAFPINISLTVAKNGGDWQIAAMLSLINSHFSTLTGAAGSEGKETKLKSNPPSMNLRKNAQWSVISSHPEIKPSSGNEC
jgi:ketosteroid isomerase-like protein